jgi:hypothetical protein
LNLLQLALLEVRNTQNKDVEDEEEKEQGGGEAAGEQDISTNIHTHEQALHYISEVMGFALIQTLPAFLNFVYS